MIRSQRLRPIAITVLIVAGLALGVWLCRSPTGSLVERSIPAADEEGHSAGPMRGVVMREVAADRSEPRNTLAEHTGSYFRGCSLRGRVVEEGGTALCEFTTELQIGLVDLDGEPTPSVQRKHVTEGTGVGEFVISDLPSFAGLVLCVNASGFASVRRDLAPGPGTVDLGVIVMQRAASCTVCVIDAASRRPVPGAFVTVEPVQSRSGTDGGVGVFVAVLSTIHATETGASRTDGQGQLRLPCLAPGWYRIWASSTNHVAAESYAHLLGGGSQEIEVAIASGSVVVARVTASNGQPQAGVSVSAFPDQTRAGASVDALTSADGTAYLGAWPDGTTLRLSVCRDSGKSLAAALRSFHPVEATVVVPVGRPVELRLDGDLYGPVVVTWPTDAADKGEEIQLALVNKGIPQFAVKEHVHLRAAAPVNRGKASLRPYAPGEFYVAAWSPSLGLCTSDTFSLSGPPELGVRLHRTEPGVTLHGRVLDQRGTPISASVEMVAVQGGFPPVRALAMPGKRNTNPDRLTGTRTDPEGRFTISGLPRGRYRLIAQSSVGTGSKELDWPGDAAEIAIEIDTSVTIEGTIVGEKPDPASRVRLFTADCAFQRVASIVGDGYRFESLPRGTYYLRLDSMESLAQLIAPIDEVEPLGREVDATTAGLHRCDLRSLTSSRRFCVRVSGDLPDSLVWIRWARFSRYDRHGVAMQFHEEPLPATKELVNQSLAAGHYVVSARRADTSRVLAWREVTLEPTGAVVDLDARVGQVTIVIGDLPLLGGARALSGVEIRLIGRGEPSPVRQSEIVLPATLDAHGFASVIAPYGRYEVVATHAGREIVIGVVSVSQPHMRATF